MDMTIHHIMRGNAGDFLQLIRGHKFNGTSQGRLNVSPNTGPYLLFTLLACLTLLMMRSYLLDGLGWRSNQSLVHGRGGRALFCHFFFLFFLNNPQLVLANAGEGFVFLCLDPVIKFLVKLSCHFCKKKRETTVKLRREEKKIKRMGKIDEPFLS